MIRLDGVSKRFPDGTVAVHELSLEVPEGEICVLVGPSGCGKTTTLKMVNRLIEPTSGRIELEGEDVTGVDPVGLRRRIGYVIQQVGLFPHQTIAANVGTVPRLLGWHRDRTNRRVNELLELVALTDAADRRAGGYSLGMRQRLGLAAALLGYPRVLVLDEPANGLDPQGIRWLRDFLRKLASEGRAILVSSHVLAEVAQTVDRVVIIDKGRLVTIAELDELLRETTLEDAFLELTAGRKA